MPRQVRRLEDGRHSLFVRARDAVGQLGARAPGRAPHRPPAAGGARLGACAAAISSPPRCSCASADSGLALLRYRVEVGGRPGRWRSLKPAAQARLTLHVTRGRRAILRVRAEDVAGNESLSGFTIPR